MDAGFLTQLDVAVQERQTKREGHEETRRLGGIRRRNEVTIAVAYDFDGPATIEQIRRLVVAAIDTLSQENNIDGARTLAYLGPGCRLPSGEGRMGRARRKPSKPPWARACRRPEEEVTGALVQRESAKYVPAATLAGVLAEKLRPERTTTWSWCRGPASPWSGAKPGAACCVRRSSRSARR
jgi:hypothetical protein